MSRAHRRRVRGRPIRPLAGAIVLLAAAVVSATAGGGQDASERVSLGVLRTDGVLLPFAVFDRKNWKTPWPANLAGRDLPANLAAIPDGWWGDAPHMEWRLWTGQSGAPRTFTIVAPTTILVGVMRRLGLRTDVPPTVLPPSPFELPFPKAGLATSGDVQIQPILSVSRLGGPASEMLRSIRSDVNAAEERTISGLRNQAGWTHPIGKAARARLDPQLEAWYTTPLAESPSTYVSYVEVVKQYPAQPNDEGCGLETFVSGWVFRTGQSAGAAKTRLKAAVMYCDRERASYMLPFGHATIRGRTHWVYQLSGQDHEWYEVAELRQDRVKYVAEYQAGGAPAAR